MREWSTITINSHPIPPFPSIPIHSLRSAPVRQVAFIHETWIRICSVPIGQDAKKRQAENLYEECYARWKKCKRTHVNGGISDRMERIVSQTKGQKSANLWHRVSEDMSTLEFKAFEERANVHVLEDTPSVISVGKRCMDHGYSFVWPSGKDPTW